ncbi:hypothetical protein EYF80_053135 [Liparis tanakae]|uniref:Uncharacterized protein n=1 Tax=Liparis tanakae TaxID=230148 RepID=A0A4Z2F740_9TELE|nr:hypothetical protein EYF80_053135 [Liparis tanakae]
MLESKLIWMYFQSNSIPLAPTHRGRHLQGHSTQCGAAHLDITSSAVAQPMAATMILYSPLPALRDITRWRPSSKEQQSVGFETSAATGTRYAARRVQLVLTLAQHAPAVTQGVFPGLVLGHHHHVVVKAGKPTLLGARIAVPL